MHIQIAGARYTLRIVICATAGHISLLSVLKRDGVKCKNQQLLTFSSGR
jgi:hypothetical protein